MSVRPHRSLLVVCLVVVVAAAADCDGEESQKKSRLHCEGERRLEEVEGGRRQDAPAPAIKLEELPVLTRWDSLAAEMLCITSSSPSPAPLQPTRHPRACSDRAAPPGIAVSFGGLGWCWIYSFCFFYSWPVPLMVFAGWWQCAPECVVCPARRSPVGAGKGKEIFFPDWNMLLPQRKWNSTVILEKKPLEYVNWETFWIWVRLGSTAL